jgi:hypothetical protein
MKLNPGMHIGTHLVSFGKSGVTNPWSTDNPNYKFGKSLLTDGDLKKLTPFTRKLHKFYMQHGKSDDNSHIMVALRPQSSAWPPRWSNGL